MDDPDRRPVRGGVQTGSATCGGLGGRLGPGGSCHETGRDRSLVEGLRQVDPRGLRQADHRRRCGTTSDPARAERRPGTSTPIRPASSTRQRSSRPRTVDLLGTEDRPAGPRQFVQQGGDDAVPAGSSCAVGSSRTRTRCPSPRCWRSQPVAARRPTARMVHGRPDERSPGVPTPRRSGRPSLGAPPGSPARTRFLTDRQFRGRELVGRRRKDDPDPAEERAGSQGRLVGAVDRDPTVRLARTTRGSTGRGERERRLAGARPTRDGDAFAATDRQVDPREAVLAASRISDAESFDQQRGRRRRRVAIGLGRHRWMTPSATSTTATAPASDEQPQPPIDRRVRDHPIRGPGRVAPRTRALRARRSAPGRQRAIRAGPG